MCEWTGDGLSKTGNMWGFFLSKFKKLWVDLLLLHWRHQKLVCFPQFIEKECRNLTLRFAIIFIPENPIPLIETHLQVIPCSVCEIRVSQVVSMTYCTLYTSSINGKKMPSFLFYAVQILALSCKPDFTTNSSVFYLELQNKKLSTIKLLIYIKFREISIFSLIKVLSITLMAWLKHRYWEIICALSKWALQKSSDWLSTNDMKTWALGSRLLFWAMLIV